MSTLGEPSQDWGPFHKGLVALKITFIYWYTIGKNLIETS